MPSALARSAPEAGVMDRPSARLAMDSRSANESASTSIPMAPISLSRARLSASHRWDRASAPIRKKGVASGRSCGLASTRPGVSPGERIGKRDSRSTASTPRSADTMLRSADRSVGSSGARKGAKGSVSPLSKITASSADPIIGIRMIVAPATAGEIRIIIGNPSAYAPGWSARHWVLTRSWYRMARSGFDGA